MLSETASKVKYEETFIIGTYFTESDRTVRNINDSRKQNGLNITQITNIVTFEKIKTRPEKERNKEKTNRGNRSVRSGRERRRRRRRRHKHHRISLLGEVREKGFGDALPGHHSHEESGEKMKGGKRWRREAKESKETWE